MAPLFHSFDICARGLIAGGLVVLVGKLVLVPSKFFSRALVIPFALLGVMRPPPSATYVRCAQLPTLDARGG